MQMHKYSSTSCWLLFLSPFPSLRAIHTPPLPGDCLEGGLAAGASRVFLPNNQNAELLKEQENHRAS